MKSDGRNSDEIPVGNNQARFNSVNDAKHYWSEVKKGSPPYPEEIEWHPSAHCTLNCSYCCSPNKYLKTSRKVLDRNTILVGYLKYWKDKLKSFQISGGREPLEDHSCIDVIKKAKELDLEVKLNTSGHSYNSRALSNIIQYCTYAAISCDTFNEKEYCSLKGVNAEVYERVLKSLKYIGQAKGECTVEIVVLPEIIDLANLSNTLFYAKKMNIDGVRMRRVKYHLNPHEVDINPNNAKDVYQQIISGYSRWYESGFLRINEEDFHVDYTKLIKDDQSPCYSSARKIVIDALGHIFPCAMKSYPGHDGVGDTSMYDVNMFEYPHPRKMWKKIVQSRKLLLENKSCSVCCIADRYLNNYVSNI
ncbi:MAG: radical SAM protein [Candidatus Thiodiazotropha taylori]